MSGPCSPARAQTRGVRSPSGRLTWREHALMADLAYAVLLVAGFLVLVMMLRGLAKL
jgi:hypothetical protein